MSSRDDEMGALTERFLERWKDQERRSRSSSRTPPDQLYLWRIFDQEPPPDQGPRPRGVHTRRNSERSTSETREIGDHRGGWNADDDNEQNGIVQEGRGDGFPELEGDEIQMNDVDLMWQWGLTEEIELMLESDINRAILLFIAATLLSELINLSGIL